MQGIDAQVVALSGFCRAVADHIPKAVAIGQLSAGDGHNLSPAPHLAQPAASMMLMGQRLKVVAWDQFQHLRASRIMMGHGLNLLIVTGFDSTSTVITCWDLSLFY